MKRVVTDHQPTDEVELKNVRHHDVPIFAKKNGEFKGMIVKEGDTWILRVGGDYGAYGHYPSVRELIARGEEFGYEFFIED